MAMLQAESRGRMFLAFVLTVVETVACLLHRCFAFLRHTLKCNHMNMFKKMYLAPVLTILVVHFIRQGLSSVTELRTALKSQPFNYFMVIRILDRAWILSRFTEAALTKLQGCNFPGSQQALPTGVLEGWELQP